MAGFRIERAHLCLGHLSQHGPAAGGQVGRQPHADVRDQGRPADCALFDDVDDVAPVHDRQVRVLAHAVDQDRQRHARQPLQRRLPAVAGSQLVYGDAESVAPLLGHVDDEPGPDQRVEQVIGRRSRQAEITADGRRRRGLRLRAEVLQHGQDLRGRRDYPHDRILRLRTQTSGQVHVHGDHRRSRRAMARAGHGRGGSRHAGRRDR